MWPTAQSHHLNMHHMHHTISRPWGLIETLKQCCHLCIHHVVRAAITLASHPTPTVRLYCHDDQKVAVRYSWGEGQDCVKGRAERERRESEQESVRKRKGERESQREWGRGRERARDWEPERKDIQVSERYRKREIWELKEERERRREWKGERENERNCERWIT